MLILASTTDKLQLITSSSSAINVHASYLDNVGGTVAPGRLNTKITTPTTTDIVSPPASGVYRNLKTLHAYNAGGSNCDLTVQHTDGTTVSQLHKATLAPGATMQYVDEVGFLFAQSTGYVPISGGTMTGNLTIAGSITPQLTLNATGGTPATEQPAVLGSKNGLTRWAVLLGQASAESGGNVGSDFLVLRYSDAGAFIDAPFGITRSTGLVTGTYGFLSGQNYSSSGANVVLAGNGGAVYLRPYGPGSASAQAILDNAGNFSTTATVYSGNGTFQSNVGNAALAGSGGLILLRPNGAGVAGGMVIAGDSQWSLANQGTVAGAGIEYPGVGGSNYFGLRWGVDVPGYPSIIVDNVVAWVVPAYSDERLKQDIAPSSYDCLGTVQKIPLHQFRPQDHSTPGKPKRSANGSLVPAGLIAQRLLEIAPHCVVKGDDAEEMNATNGNPHVVWNIDSNNMLATLIGAIQQLSARVEELEAELEAR